jgi:hypothetical protein
LWLPIRDSLGYHELVVPKVRWRWRWSVAWTFWPALRSHFACDRFSYPEQSVSLTSRSSCQTRGLKFGRYNASCVFDPGSCLILLDKTRGWATERRRYAPKASPNLDHPATETMGSCTFCSLRRRTAYVSHPADNRLD